MMKPNSILPALSALLLSWPTTTPAQEPSTKPADSKVPVVWPSRPRLIIWTAPAAGDEGAKRKRTDDLFILPREKEAITGCGFDFIALQAEGLLRPGHPDDEIRLLQTACRAHPSRIILATLPVGTDGWEATQNREEMSRRVGKDALDDIAAITRKRHFANLAQVDAAAAYALIFAGLNRDAKVLKPDAVGFYADTFAAFCKDNKKPCWFWFSANSLRDPNEAGLIRRMVDVTKGRVEGYVWTDVPARVAAGESNLDELLKKILELTPADKTVVQYEHGKKLMTAKPPGVLDFASACRALKIDAFAVRSPWTQLAAKPWKDFYRFDPPPAPPQPTAPPTKKP